jgi:putative ATP-dependent endonuclease of OLD family
MSILIEKARIKNFRSLKNVAVNLSPITLLVGANNSGKTTFLRALQLAFKGDGRFVSHEDLFIGKDGKSLPKAERIITIDVKIVPFEGDEFEDIWTDVINDGLEGIRQDDSGNYFFAFQTRIDFTKSNIKFERFLITNWNNGDIDENQRVGGVNLKAFPFYFIDAQRDLQEDLGYRKSNFGELINDIDYNDDITERIESDLENLNQKAIEESKVLKHTKTSLEELNQALQTQGSGVEITPFPKKVRDLHKGIKVHFKDGQSDSFSMEYHGMGTRSWASLLALKAKILWDKKKADSTEDKAQDAFFPILALEEPEAHLHPNAQRQVYRQLSSIKGQKFISTHSPYIAGVAELSELRCFSKNEDFVEVGRVNIEGLRKKELDKIEKEIIGSKGEFLFAKIIILVEGPTEENIFPVFAKKYWNCHPFEKGIYFANCEGTNINALLHFVKAFKIIWFLFSDYDKERVKKDINNSLKNVLGVEDLDNQSNIVLLKDNIESYLYEEGYEEELKISLKQSREPDYKNEQHKKTKEQKVAEQNRKINTYEKVELLEALKSYKVKASKYYAEAIVNTADENRQIPTKIKELFEAIDKILNP